MRRCAWRQDSIVGFLLLSLHCWTPVFLQHAPRPSQTRTALGSSVDVLLTVGTAVAKPASCGMRCRLSAFSKMCEPM